MTPDFVPNMPGDEMVFPVHYRTVGYNVRQTTVKSDFLDPYLLGELISFFRTGFQGP